MSTTHTQPARLDGDVTVKINFLNPPADGSVPFAYVEQPPAGQPRQNFSETTHDVSLTDIRNHEDEYTLDTDAVQFFKNVSSSTTAKTFDSDAAIEEIYYPEVKKFLLEHVPGAQHVVIFDHTVRKHNPDARRQPVNFAHVDQTARAAEQRVRRSVPDPEQAEALLRGRYRLINVWRPLNGNVESMPLAFATAASVETEDLTPIERRYPTFTGETMGIKFNPGQKWLYWSGIDDDERIFLKCFDSEDGVGRRVPHTAFQDPRSGSDAKPRESIEVRTLVFDQAV